MTNYIELQYLRNKLLKEIEANQVQLEKMCNQPADALHKLKSIIYLRKELVKIQYQLIECLIEKGNEHWVTQKQI